MTSDRLSHLSQRMAAATLWLIVAMLLLNAVCWLYPGLNSIRGGYGLRFALTDRLISKLDVDVGLFPYWQKLGGVVLSSVPLLALATGLRHLRCLFRAYGRRDYFSPTAANHLGKVGRSVGLWVVLNLMCEPLLSTWLTMRAPVEHRMITLSFGSQDIVALFLAACITVIAHILRQASELNSENQQFV
ncbi:DUF2975 domain-containing protein [Burkholderia cepacia]|uniref:DUF2975 domain-containing protein n=1 Tax=Burkholderia cepacia TaxID=292 RepID=UPI00158DDC08|nr:DUF2975 domain-containing protein [Burkholderia cepacia]